MGHKNGKPAKAKRAGKKPAATSPRADRTARPTAGNVTESPAPTATKSSARAQPRKRKRRADPAATGAPPPQIDRQADPPKLSSDPGREAGPADGAAAGPALPLVTNPGTGERRRWPERAGPAPHSSHGKRAGSDSRSTSADSGEAPQRTNKLVPTNAVHPTERRIKRRMHKNSALVVTAGAVLLGVLILGNQSRPPDVVLSDRQTAARLPAGQDWPNDAPSDSPAEAAGRDSARAGDMPQASAPSARWPIPARDTLVAARPNALAGTDRLSSSDIVEMERLLKRLDLTARAADGVLDDDTAQAIRLYQEFAGLPVDGKASRDLLTDLREVVQILDNTTN